MPAADLLVFATFDLSKARLPEGYVGIHGGDDRARSTAREPLDMPEGIADQVGPVCATFGQSSRCSHSFD